MPAFSFGLMNQAILDAIDASGGVGCFVSAAHTSPRIFAVSHNGRNYRFAIYIWTLTPGGRQSLPNEYRIQMTSVVSPLALSEGDLTVLMGYWPEQKVFGAFDILAHRSFTTGSPSIQISNTVLYGALQNGLAFGIKNNDEIVIGVRPDQFLTYVENNRLLHQHGHVKAQLVEEMEATASNPELDLETVETAAPTERLRILTEVNRAVRSGRFAISVLNAYGHRCAVTRIQLKLVEAAHILPVAAPGSVDSVSNGIALSPTIHKAYDSRLIYFDEEYVVKLNGAIYQELQSMGRGNGIEQIEPYLNQRIHLPQEIIQRPNTEYIRKGNQYRGIPGY